MTASPAPAAKTPKRVLKGLSPDTPHLAAVLAAAEQQAARPAAGFSANIDDIADQFAVWRQVDTNLLEPMMQLMPDVSLPCQMAAVLAAVASPMPFHNHHHTREVAFLSMMLGRELQADARAELFVAACIHDFMHDGRGNHRGGKHTPMRLERKALDAAFPYMKAAGLPDTSWQRIRVMVLATDVSKDTSTSVSPAEWMRRAFESRPVDDCPQELQPLFADPSLAHQAALLEDSDLGTSAGLPYDCAKCMTALVAEETRVLSPTPQTLIGFIDHICHGTFITPEARALFGNNMQTLRAAATIEAAETIYHWS